MQKDENSSFDPNSRWISRFQVEDEMNISNVFLKNLREQIESARNEEDISKNWLVPILEKVAPKTNLARRWEKKNQKKRKDLALVNTSWNREVCNVELKYCSDKELIKNGADGYFLQVHRYAYSQNYWRDRAIYPVLGILTNGNTAILFDGSRKRNDSWNHRTELDLQNDQNMRQFIQIFQNLGESKKGHFRHPDPIFNEKDIVVEELSKYLIKSMGFFEKNRIKNPFDAILQMFLVAVLRDCGYIPTRLMDEACEHGRWDEISELLNTKLGSNFTPLCKTKHDVIRKVYQETRILDAALNRVPSDCLGLVYEKILHKHQKNKKSTSYYTPNMLITKIVTKLDIGPNQTVLDPTCGSGSFLTGVIQYVTDKYPEMKEPDTLFNYICRKIRGIDKDPLACNVAKTMILAAAANALDFDPAERDLNIPNLDDTIIHDDMFLHSIKTKFDVIIGNLPWGTLDTKNKNQILDRNTRIKLEPFKEKYDSFNRNVDISSIALEHLVDNFLKPSGTLGILVKQQSLWGEDASKKFKPWAKKNGIVFWDYYDKVWFTNPASLTAIAWKNTDQTKFILNKGETSTSIAKNGVLLSQFGKFYRGFESGKAWIWREAALKKINNHLCKKLYPDNSNATHFYLPKNAENIVFIKPGSDAPASFVDSLSKEDQEELENRSQVAKKYAYRGAEGLEDYNFDGSQMRIVFPEFLNKERMCAMLDVKGERIGMKSHMIFIPKVEHESWETWCILAWLNTKYFKDELRSIKAKTLGFGRIAVYPSTLNVKAKIPTEIMNESFSNWVQKQIMKGCAPEDIENKIIKLVSIKDKNVIGF